MTTQAPQILDHDQFQAAAKAARDRFAMLKAKHPTLKGYLVLFIPGKQTGIGSSAKEILGDLPALIVDDAAKAAFQQHLMSPPPKDAGEKAKKEWDERFEEHVAELKYNGGVRVELRFDNLDYALIARLQSDELVDRELTPDGQFAKPSAMIFSILEGVYDDYLGATYDNADSRHSDLEKLSKYAANFTDILELLQQLSLISSTDGDPTSSSSTDHRSPITTRSPCHPSTKPKASIGKPP